ncbi:hypothetical protein CI109_105673 [Kwoniella shandongensis]|uniref:ERCC1-like central domain-containing protein n=1 Tax=Kwoniella shandongensis TaxID=1734106 RepID=A0A5M6C185_9TREE|nr:uncharacterized protein CI109_003013 [Kwoniella shandongensis]KAA5528481.1 hypothetical protein CI109_003013 [Kwoniella shandongensis]
MTDDPSSAAGGSTPMPPPQPSPAGFQSASSFLKTNGAGQPTSTTSGSLRNASGGLPPIPKESPAPSPAGIEANTATASAGQPQVAGSSKPINRPAASKNSIIYSAVQRRNPVLGSIRNVGIEIGDIVADYQVGTHNGVLFLSLKYHRLHPEYIHQRIEKMRASYNLRIVLVLCDVGEHQQSLRELTKIAIINEFTVFVAWSNEEVAQYLTCFKAFEHKSADTLKERVQQTYHDQLQHVLTSGRKVNKTDADNLAAQFGSFAHISKQSAKVLSNVKGLGATKVTSLIDAFNKPFLVGGLRRDEKAKGTPAVISEKERRAVGSAGDQGKETAEVEAEPIGSPDWPEQPEEEEEEEEEEEQPIRQARRREPSRSPGLSPELGGVDTEALALGIWQDPLDLDEDEEDGPSTKRARVGE